MPEYLAPGVYVEEVSFRSKSIEGVSTSTAGFVGPARFGPITGEPELLTSFADFERIYGDLEDLKFGNDMKPNYLAHGVRAFFEEGGRRLYVSRVFGAANFTTGANGVPAHHGAFVPTGDSPAFRLVARFPGLAGNMQVFITPKLGGNIVSGAGNTRRLQRVRPFDVVSVRKKPSNPNPNDNNAGAAVGTADGLMVATQDAATGAWTLVDPGSSFSKPLSDDPTFAEAEIRPLTMVVEVSRPVGSPPVFGPAALLGEFGLDPRGASALLSTFTVRPATRLEALTMPFAIELSGTVSVEQRAMTLARALFSEAVRTELRKDRPSAATLRVPFTFSGGDDGNAPDSNAYAGEEAGLVDFINDVVQAPKNGLLAFESLEDISIVAAPGYSAFQSGDERLGIHNAVINHAEKMKYRIAVLDTPANHLPTEALNFRNLRSSKYAAIYYPWIWVADPRGGGRLKLPPSGFVAGIYARNDINRAVFKAPANEVVRLAVDFELRLNKAQQELLNPEGVNCFRFFEGHGFLIWGARTISDDPEWKYVNLRRYFAYLEHSIDRGTQWAVFENNSRPLWDNVRRTIEDFLLNEWKMGALLGDKPEQAYFVRCDLSTMTQNDLDNGRLVCLIGVAPVRPAEFVIFRIGQWTANATV